MHPLSRQIDHARQQERHLAIVRDYKNGIPVDRIAEKYSVFRTNLYRILHKYGITKRRVDYDEKTKAKALKLLKKGLSMAEVTRRTEVKKRTLSRMRVKEGMPFRIRRKGETGGPTTP